MSNYNNTRFTTTTVISNGILTRDGRKADKAKDVQGRISTNGSKLVSMQHSKEEIERKVVDCIDYRLLRKNGALRK